MEQLVAQGITALEWARTDLADKLLTLRIPGPAWHEKHAESMALTLLIALVVLAAVHGVASR